MQGTQVQSLVEEDPTCYGATKPTCHNYWVHALEPGNCNYRAHVLQLRRPEHLEPVRHDKRSHRNEKPTQGNKEQPLRTATRENSHNNKEKHDQKKKKSVVFIYTNNKQNPQKNKNKENSPIYNNNKKYLYINLSKDMKN